MINRINAPTSFTSILLSTDINKRKIGEIEELKEAECVDFVSRAAGTPLEEIRRGLGEDSIAVINTKNGIKLVGDDIRLEASIVHRLRDGKNALDPHAKLIDDFSPTLNIEA